MSIHYNAVEKFYCVQCGRKNYVDTPASTSPTKYLTVKPKDGSVLRALLTPPPEKAYCYYCTRDIIGGDIKNNISFRKKITKALSVYTHNPELATSLIADIEDEYNPATSVFAYKCSGRNITAWESMLPEVAAVEDMPYFKIESFAAEWAEMKQALNL